MQTMCKRGSVKLRLASAFVTIILLSLSAHAQDQHGPKKKIIFDQDTDGVIGGNENPLIMLLQADNIDVMGVTVVTGNGWLKQETADVLKTLELMNRPDVPVYMGSEFPLVQTREELLLLTKLYGGNRTDAYLGAYAADSPAPDSLVPPPGGFSKLKPQPGHAAEFIIKTIRENPNQVTLYCGGALTNIALAIRVAPDIVPLTKEIVFMGTSEHYQPKTVNVIYDPEAAQIVLRAPWPKLTLVTVDISEKVHMDLDLVQAIVNGQNKPIADLHRKLVLDPYLQHHTADWFRMPDEMTAAYVIDPSIFTETRRLYVDIDIMHGMNYGASSFWDEVPKSYGGAPWPDQPYPGIQKPLPPPGARIANVLWDLDIDRFKKLFIDLMTRPQRTH
jgi:purine nucleosidase